MFLEPLLLDVAGGSVEVEEVAGGRVQLESLGLPRKSATSKMTHSILKFLGRLCATFNAFVKVLHSYFIGEYVVPPG